MTAPAFESRWLNWTPNTPGQRTDNTDKTPSVGFVGSKTEQFCIDALDEDQRERFEERAAVMQYDAGLSRQKAELLALKDIMGETDG